MLKIGSRTHKKSLKKFKFPGTKNGISTMLNNDKYCYICGSESSLKIGSISISIYRCLFLPSKRMGPKSRPLISIELIINHLYLLHRKMSR